MSTATDEIVLAILREQSGKPDAAMNAFNIVAILAAIEMVMVLIEKCQEDSGDDFAADKVLAAASDPTPLRRFIAIRLTRKECDLSRRESVSLVDGAARAAEHVTADQLTRMIEEQEGAFAL